MWPGRSGYRWMQACILDGFGGVLVFEYYTIAGGVLLSIGARETVG